MKDYNTYYWCPSCNHGFVESEVETRVVQEGFNHGHNNAEPEERETICHECHTVLSDGYKCATCQEIFEQTHEYRSDRHCIDCLPLIILESIYADAKFNATLLLASIAKLDHKKAVELIDEAHSDYINNEYRGE